MTRPLIGIIVDNFRIKKWQAQALSNLTGSADFLILNCTNTSSTRALFRYGLYYVLNLVALRNEQTKQCPLSSSLQFKAMITFEAVADGKWQQLPREVMDDIRALQPQALVKFGMGLLRVPDDLEIPILSYHHGDPRAYRGRPAGFYELLNRERSLGQVVQILSNRLDGGSIVAFAETRVHLNSYRQTMVDAYRASPLILTRALQNALRGLSRPLDEHGINYRLPSNRTVLRLGWMLLRAKVDRWLYGLFFEKAWRVAEAPVSSPIENLLNGFPAPQNWRKMACPRGYRFLADPFPDPRGGILVEALRRSDDQGEILRLNEGTITRLCSRCGHFSYPAPFRVDGRLMLLPEVANWSSPILYRVENDLAVEAGPLTIEGYPRLTDVTPYVADGGEVFLFGNRSDEGGGVLRLWTAKRLQDPFVEHPLSPIRISPSGSRMGGLILRSGDRLVRIGQDLTRAYGDGVVLFEISELSNVRYAEHLLGNCKFKAVNGPHTINMSGGGVLFDFYSDRFSLTAGLRRLTRVVRTVSMRRQLPRAAMLTLEA